MWGEGGRRGGCWSVGVGVGVGGCACGCCLTGARFFCPPPPPEHLQLIFTCNMLSKMILPLLVWYTTVFFIGKCGAIILVICIWMSCLRIESANITLFL